MPNLPIQPTFASCARSPADCMRYTAQTCRGSDGDVRLLPGAHATATATEVT